MKHPAPGRPRARPQAVSRPAGRDPGPPRSGVRRVVAADQPVGPAPVSTRRTPAACRRAESNTAAAARLVGSPAWGRTSDSSPHTAPSSTGEVTRSTARTAPAYRSARSRSRPSRGPVSGSTSYRPIGSWAASPAARTLTRRSTHWEHTPQCGCRRVRPRVWAQLTASRHRSACRVAASCPRTSALVFHWNGFWTANSPPNTVENTRPNPARARGWVMREARPPITCGLIARFRPVTPFS